MSVLNCNLPLLHKFLPQCITSGVKITNPTVKELVRHYREISLLGRIKATLDWDLNVNLPPKASEGRAQQSAYLTDLTTKLWLNENFRKNVEKANSLTGKLSDEEKAIIRNVNFAGKYYFNVPRELIIEKEEVASKGFMAWKEAKDKNNYSIFLPSLKELFRLDQIIASHLKYDKNPYDALLNMFEPELTAAKAKKAFDAIKPDLIKLVKQVQKSKEYLSESPFFANIDYSRTQQTLLIKSVMRKMGFDFQAGRLDVSPHPFTTGLDRYDVRVTTMYHDNDFRTSYTSTMHETGHALYELGINPDYSATPLEGGVSYGIHEALSRFWENMVGRNPAFLTYMTPLFQSFFPDQLSNTNEIQLARLINLVKPSFVRIEADEITYSLHIILRFEMENELLNGKIDLKDAPEVWREKSKEYFGIAPDKDSEGILQDVHWSYGAIGYFPSYALGNLYGAQLLNAMKKEINFETELERGNLLTIKGWLDQNVHRFGSLYFPNDLIKNATGEELNPTYFIEYLKNKYSSLYPSQKS